MKRFYGSAVFEEEEVADSAFTQLQNIRGEETRRIEYYNTEFKMQIDELEFWRVEELADIDTNSYNQIDAQNRLIAQYHREIAQIKTNTYYAIGAVQAQALLKFHVKLTSEENAAVASIQSNASFQIQNQNRLINQSRRRIAQIKFEGIRLIAQVHRDFAIEYNIQLTRRDKDIVWAHSDATAKIAAVIARRYYVPVFMMRCAKGPCEFCRAKYGTTGTRDELEKLECIPPFHDDCRCWLEEVGYVVMTR
jgi:ribosomal protein L29